MPGESDVTSSLTLISPFISQRELEGLFSWVCSHLGPMPAPRVQPLIEPRSGEDALRLEFVSLERDPAKLYQTIRATPPPVPLHAASIVPGSIQQAGKKLYVFDMDSTFINQEAIDEIGREIGAYDRFAEITEEAMKGQIDFVQAFRDRVAMLNGLYYQRAEAILPRITLSPGIESFIRAIQKSGASTMIVSGGFDFVLRHFQNQLGIDRIHAHELQKDESGFFDGKITGPIIDGEKKRSLVQERMRELGVKREETVIVGDGANDIKMMSEAGTQVSFQGKEKLSQVVNTWIFDRHYRWLKSVLGF